MSKFIFVTGGVVSSLGKGVFASCLGMLLKNRGLKVYNMKFDPYFNVDPGTMSPYQHGEVYVTKDGAETDLDLGHYERWVNNDLTKECSLTSGKIYLHVLEKERHGDYLGATVQIIPHITNEIKSRMLAAASVSNADVVICEIGGTVGDIEGLAYLEAIRQMRIELGYENTMFFHNTLVPYLKASEENKTKPTQHSTKELTGLGILPDAIVLRCEVPLSESEKGKISLFCNVPREGVFEADDLKNVYELPFKMHEQGLDEYTINHLHLTPSKELDLSDWEKWSDSVASANKKVVISLVGKYVELKDAYLSVKNALEHSGYPEGYKVDIRWIQSANLTEDNVEETLSGSDGVLVPGGFGERGTEGKKLAIRYAREKKIPYLGICLGMQLAIIEFAENVAGLKGANTTEFDPKTPYPVIDLLKDQYAGIDLGGTLRLGNYDCDIKNGTLAEMCYGTTRIAERHRHRYEFNNKYKTILEDSGMVFSGVNPETGLCEIIELKDHPFFIGCQFHPEFTSRPLKANPLFKGFVLAAIKVNENSK